MLDDWREKERKIKISIQSVNLVGYEKMLTKM